MAVGAESVAIQSGVQRALLGLVIERPSYGYELAQRFDRAYGSMLRLSSSSQIYSALGALERRGLVEEVGGSGGARQPKTRYRASEAGLVLYTRMLAEEAAEERRRSRVFARQLAALADRPQEALEVIAALRAACTTELAGLPLYPEPGEGVSALTRRLETEDGRLALAAKLSWCDFAAAQFNALLAAEHQRG